jgi:Tfp pilus assembly protein PilE
MKCPVLLLAFLAVAALPAWPQTSAQSPAHAGHDHAQMHAQHMEHMQARCKQMMAEHVAEMKDTAQTLATNLAQMKAMLPLINDINERSRWQSNIAMWQAVADHFNHTAQHAEHLQAMGLGCPLMLGHVMQNKPAPPAQPQ